MIARGLDSTADDLSGVAKCFEFGREGTLETRGRACEQALQDLPLSPALSPVGEREASRRDASGVEQGV